MFIALVTLTSDTMIHDTSSGEDRSEEEEEKTAAKSFESALNLYRKGVMRLKIAMLHCGLPDCICIVQ